jgi:hypothetical protein
MNGEQRCAIRIAQGTLQPGVQPTRRKPATLQALFLILSKITAWLKKKTKIALWSAL